MCNVDMEMNCSNGTFVQVKYCKECKYKINQERCRVYREKNIEKIKQRKRELYYSKGKKLICVQCGKEFYRASYINKKFCSRKCFHEESKESRKGTNNPAYRNGTRVKGRSVSWRHLDATRKYGRDFLEKNGYKYCENCGINQSLRFETHHIVFASEMPRHNELHNVKNLILVCIKCHNNFHSGKTHEKRIELVKARGLVELFGKTIL